MTEVGCWNGPRAVLGESPVWNHQEKRLYWVDCDQKRLFALDPSTGSVRTTEMPHHPGCYAFRKDGSLIVAYRNKLALVDRRTGEHREIPVSGADYSQERFNDGACDRMGRLWAGTMHKRMEDPVGSLFRIDSDLRVTKEEGGFVVSNGMAFSPDDRIMYHTDSRRETIFALDYDLENGAATNRRVFAEFSKRRGRPDGCTVDAEGCLWVAAIGSGRVVRLDRDGREIREIPLPISRPSSVAFGGTDLKTLFITSMRHGLSPEAAAREPDAGALFSVELDVPGIPEPFFAG